MKGKILKNITKILAILVICLISFIGIYIQKANRMENVVKDFELTRDLKGYRQIILEVSDAVQVLSSEGKVIGNTDTYSDDDISTNSYTKTETVVNNQEDLNEENYKKAKTIIEKRLKSLGVEDYNISLDNVNGQITILLPEDSNTDHVVSNLTQVGKFAIKDSETGVEYIDNDDLKKVSAVYNTTTTGTTVYLQIELNKNGTKVLNNLSTGDYATIEESEETTDTTSEENTTNTVESTVETDTENTTTETEDIVEEESTETTESTQKQITLAIDTDEMITTSFDEPMVDGIMDLAMGQASTDSEQITETLQSVSTVAMILNEGQLPLTYKVSNNMYVQSNTATDIIKYAVIGITVIAVAMIVCLIIKYRSKGFWAAVSYLGFAALYLLLIRYANVNISIASLVGILIVLVLNFILNKQLLNKEENNRNKVYKSFIMKIIPVFIVSIIFTFMNWTLLNTFGMIMFWGITLIIIYNILITRSLIKVK